MERQDGHDPRRTCFPSLCLYCSSKFKALYITGRPLLGINDVVLSFSENSLNREAQPKK